MKCFPLIAIALVVFLSTATTRTYAAEEALDSDEAASTNVEESLDAAASSLDEAHKQEKRYIGGAWDPYSSRLGLDGSSLYNSAGYGGYAGYNGLGTGLSGYGGYGGYGAYGGYGNYAGSGYGPYAGYGSPYSYYNARFGTGYPNSRFGAYGSYPSSYYGGYSNSVVGGGLGALGASGVVPPVGIGSGYQYGPGISGTVY